MHELASERNRAFERVCVSGARSHAPLVIVVVGGVLAAGAAVLYSSSGLSPMAMSPMTMPLVDLALVLAALSIAIGALLWMTRGTGPARLVVAGSMMLVVMASLSLTPRHERDSEPPVRLTRASEYVTSSACRSCHPSEYASWHDSFHRTMTQPAN